MTIKQRERRVYRWIYQTCAFALTIAGELKTEMDEDEQRRRTVEFADKIVDGVRGNRSGNFEEYMTVIIDAVLQRCHEKTLERYDHE